MARRQKDFTAMLRYAFPEGTRIIVYKMGRDPDPVQPESRGTVVHVDDAGTVHCNFDDGRSLGLLFDEDVFCPLSQRQLDEEEAGYGC